MTSSPHGPYIQGYTRTTMAKTKAKRNREVKPNAKHGLSSGLWSATRPHEVGISSNRRSAGCSEYVPLGLVHTARQTTKAGCISQEAGGLTVRGQLPRLWSMIRVKS